MRVLLSVLLVSACQTLFAQWGQPASTAPKVIPPSPEASNLGKFVEAPVGLYTGVPNISIPIYDVEAGMLKVPVSLEYHGSGIKVAEMASWVGSGWALNAGGLITRTVRGKPDDCDYGTNFFEYSTTYTYNQIMATQGPARAAAMQELANGSSDSQPDQYYINANGLSAKFTFDWNRQIVVDHDKRIKISKIQDPGGMYPDRIIGWEVVDDQGIIYKFGAVETTYADPQGALGPVKNGTFASSWHLTEIKDPNSDHTITLTYDDYLLDYEFKAGISSNHPALGGGPCVGGPSIATSLARTVVNGKRIMEINTSNGSSKVTFAAGATRTDNVQLSSGGASTNFKYLDYILIKNNNQEEIKRFQLGFDYSTTRLTLRSVTPKKGSTNLSPPYSMNYDAALPSELSFAQDHWGYYNGVENTNLLPDMFVELGYQYPVHLTGADRNPNVTHTKAGSLIKLTYPTGGYSEFDFEAHDYGYSQSAPVVRYQIDHVSAFASNTELQVSQGGSPTQTQSFTVNPDPNHPGQKIPVTINWSMFTDAATDLKKPRVIIWKSDMTTQVYFQKRGYIPDEDGGNHEQGNTEILSLDPGTYYLQAICQLFGDVNDYVQITVSWDSYNSSTIYKTNQSGGLRIKEIRQYAHAGDPDFSVRQFKYKMSGETGRSSGVIFQEPLYMYEHIVYCSPSPQEQYATQVFTRLSNNMTMLGLTQGSHIGYREVETTYGTGSNLNGKTNSTFDTAFDFPAGIYTELPFRPFASESYKLGLLKEETTYKYSSGSYVPVSKNQNSYTTRSAFVLAISAMYLGDIDIADHYAVGAYLDYFGKSVLTESIQTVYNSDGSASLVTTNQTFYDTYLNRVIKATQQTGSNPKLITENYYPTDVTYPSTPVNTMVLRNIISTPLEVVRKKVIGGTEFIVSADYTEFDYNYTTTQVRIGRKKYLDLSSPISSGFNYAYNGFNGSHDSRYRPVLEFNSYDNSGNLTQYTTGNGIPYSYKWGYSQTYPIAEVENAASTQIFYTSFEDASGTSGDSKTGKKYYSSGTYPITDPPTATANLVMTFWYYDGQWKFQSEIPYSSTVTKAGATRLDEVRVYPKGSRMRTFTYDPLIGSTSECDVNNRVTSYKYDTANRLRLVSDNEDKILKTFLYHYQGQ